MARPGTPLDEAVRRLAKTMTGPYRARRTSNGWMVHCPAHNDRTPSLHVSPRRDGSPGTIVYCFAGCSFQDISHKAKAMGVLLGNNPIEQKLSQIHRQNQKTQDFSHSLSANRADQRTQESHWAGPQGFTPLQTNQAQNIDFSLREHGPPTQVWTYMTPDGQQVIAFVARYQTREGDKSYRPWSWYRNHQDEIPKLIPKAPPAPRPLYGQEHLLERPNAPVGIIEGEKCVDAARILIPDLVWVAPMGGASSSHKADFRPLQDRRVIILADSDHGGRQGASQIMTTLLRDGITPRACEILEPGTSFPYHPLTPPQPHTRQQGWNLDDAWLTEMADQQTSARWREDFPQGSALAPS